jgi:hypothetical protein
MNDRDRKMERPVDLPQGFGNPYRLAPFAPGYTGQFDDRQLFRDALCRSDEKKKTVSGTIV